MSEYTVDKVMLGSTRVYDAKVNDTNVFPPRYRYPHMVVSELEGKSLFSTDLAENILPMSTGLAWNTDSDISYYDWSGVALAVDVDGGQARDSVTCCTLVSEHYACAGRFNVPAVDDTVYFLNRDGDEVSRTVVTVTHSDDEEVNLIELSAAVDPTVDKVKAYGIVSNYEDINGRLLVNIEQDRKVTLTLITKIYKDIVEHKQMVADTADADDYKVWVPGINADMSTLDAGDGGKPGFLAYEGEMLVVIGGHQYKYYSPPWCAYADEFDLVMDAAHSETFRRVTVEAPKYWPRQGNVQTYGMGSINTTNTWEWFFTSTDRNVGTWWNGNPTPAEVGINHGGFWLHNPGGFGPDYPPMDYRQWDFAIAYAIANPSDPDIQERCSAANFTTWASDFSSKYTLGIYYGQPQTLEPLAGETPAEWVVRAKASLAPVLDIRPRPLICLDYVIGQEDDFTLGPDHWVRPIADNWAILGGNDGGIALLYEELAKDGYEMLHEPFTRDTADATWCKDNGELIVNTTRIDREEAATPWSMSGAVELVPHIEQGGRRVILLNEMDRDDPPAEKSAAVKAITDMGFDPVATTTNGYDGNVAWTLVTVPDLHSYTEDAGDNDELNAMIQWIVDNKTTYNIQHVAFLGDLTNQNVAGWVAAKAAISLLDEELPYTLCPGNHDEYYSMLNEDPQRPSHFPDYFQIDDNSLNNTVGNQLVEFNPGKYYQGAYRVWDEPVFISERAASGTNNVTTMATDLEGATDYWVGRYVTWTSGALNGVTVEVLTSTLVGAVNTLTFADTTASGGPHAANDGYNITNGRKWVILNLDFRADIWYDYFYTEQGEWASTQQSWAQGVIEAYPERDIMIIAHSCLSEGADGYGEPIGTRLAAEQSELFEYLTSRYSNIQLILSGHALDHEDVDTPDPGPMATIRQETIGQGGNVFHEIVFNTQELPNGGEGILRLYDFLDDGVTINVRTYSVNLDEWLTGNRHVFQLKLDKTTASRPLNREPNLKCLIPFEETSGTDAHSIVPPDHHLDMRGGTYLAEGKFGRGYSLPYNHWLEMQNNQDMTGTTYTVALWVKIAAWGSIYDHIVRKKHPSEAYYEFNIALSDAGTGEVTYRTAGSGGIAAVVGATPLTLGEWQHVAMTCNGSTFQGYLNGSTNGGTGDVTGNKITEITEDAAEIQIMALNTTGATAADVDDFRYYDRELTAAEVLTLATDPYGVI